MAGSIRVERMRNRRFRLVLSDPERMRSADDRSLSIGDLTV